VRIEVIASGSSGNAYALHQEGAAPLLLEAGIQYKRLQAALHHRVTSLAGALISHEHGDHGKAAQNLIRAGVDVYATAGTLGALKLTGHRAHALSPIEPRVIDRHWTVMAFPAVHDAAEPAGFLVSAADGDRLLYLSDSAYCAHTFANLTLVMIEANYSEAIMHDRVMKGSLDKLVAVRTIHNHLSLERAVQFLNANDLTKVKEIHLLHLSDGNADEATFRETVERATGVPTYIAGTRAAA
jgi:phosphoribosyl 1,2-cyclic phosphodiesterase